MSDKQLLIIASASVFASQDFPQATEDWEHLLSALKTWTAWKTEFLCAHQERARLLQAQGGGNIGSANTAGLTDQSTSCIDSYLDGLANAATQDSQQLALLVESNWLLSEQVATLTTRLGATTPAVPTVIPPGDPTTNSAPMTAIEKLTYRIKVKKYDPTGYCWSHGYMVGKTHTSESCIKKKEGHKDKATRADIKGGRTFNSGWEVGWQNI